MYSPKLTGMICMFSMIIQYALLNQRTNQSLRSADPDAGIGSGSFTVKKSKLNTFIV
jgi:hypothetical protein